MCNSLSSVNYMKVTGDYMDRRQITDIITAIMRNRGWMQKDLAEHLGTTPATISRWMNGKTTPSNKDIKQLEALSTPEPITVHTLPPAPPIKEATNNLMVQIKIFGTISSPDDINNQKYSIGELSLPSWLLGQNFNDCFGMKLSAKFLAPMGGVGVFKTSKIAKDEDVVVAYVDSEIFIDRRDQVPFPKSNLSILGVLILTINSH